MTKNKARKYRLKKEHTRDLERAQKICLGLFNKFNSSHGLAAYAAIGAVLEESKRSDQERRRRFLRTNRPFPLGTGGQR